MKRRHRTEENLYLQLLAELGGSLAVEGFKRKDLPKLRQEPGWPERMSEGEYRLRLATMRRNLLAYLAQDPQSLRREAVRVGRRSK
jgi:hypothetical protein